MIVFDFAQYPGPEWNGPHTVSQALAAAWAAADQASATAACDRLLYAAGNYHAGTYYPVACVLVPALGPMLVSERLWPAVVALEVLVDLCGSFVPEPGFESMTLPDGSACPTPEALHRAAAELAPLLQSMRRSPSARASEKELAAEILQELGLS